MGVCSLEFATTEQNHQPKSKHQTYIIFRYQEINLIQTIQSEMVTELMSPAAGAAAPAASESILVLSNVCR